MSKQGLIFYLINIVGGIAVLVSYVYGLSTQVELRGDLWGAVPESIRPYYTICMFLSAAGYFFFTAYIIIHIPFDSEHIFKTFDFTLINLLYAGFIIPSVFWISMTFSMIINPSPLLWIGIRSVLFTVGFSSVGLLGVFIFSDFDKTSWLYFAGVIGLIPFCIQTMILDALVWPAYFPR
ncbi:MAG: hypothetical protein QGH24_00135 [Candidatus Marinimicrobia bacterium]|jgi:hypothetical protein|nr:hypothetical protein [Candidatus Neomarinimicrobiota bacterium]